MIDTSGTNMVRFPFRPRHGDPLTPHAVSFPDGIGQVELPTGQIAWLVSRHEYVRQVLRSPDFSSDFTKPGFPMIRALPQLPDGPPPGMFIRMDGLDHARLRRMLVPEFMIRQIRTLEPLIRETVVGALDAMRAAGPPADLVESFALPVPSMVICHLLGVPYSDHTFFQERSRIMLAWSTPPQAALAARDEIRDYLDKLVRQRDGGEDLISRLAAERVATGEMTMEELAGAALLLLVAGHETTSNMIGLSTLALLQNPRQMRRLREQPESMADAVEELLRYLSIVRTGLTRAAVADTEIGGQVIKAGEGVIALLSGANHDTAVFADPGDLDLTRGSHQHMAFGFGVHQCLGQPLARAELRIALTELLTRLPGLALAVDPAEIEYRDALIFGAHRLPVTW
ncbi:cytochrome P450 [Acrocarpospora pleiomorpha]|uniref:Cytochrome P450 n=1 Tax=Acrocarpospora pleiomorpha TaxID=90975 RepID=A0A5M3XIM6_9ACTN|nr:cytochrome P450 [Acrocarpospora pleiomorpha]GES20612.1 cytochrome P450 [Acrocarpospora pleiomorpha]